MLVPPGTIPMNPTSDLHGRVGVITGGASGIGRATALLLARHGARVFVGDYRLQPENDDLFDSLKIHQQQCDVRNSDDVSRLIDTAVSTAGGVDILVNNAGIVFVRQIPDTTEAEWDAV